MRRQPRLFRTLGFKEDGPSSVKQALVNHLRKSAAPLSYENSNPNPEQENPPAQLSFPLELMGSPANTSKKAG